MRADIAIIGLSGVYPGAADIEELAANLHRGVDSVGEPSAERLASLTFQPSERFRQLGTLPRIDTFDHEFFQISRREAEFTDPQQRLVLELSCAAIESAGYRLADLRGTRTAVVLSAASTDYQHLFERFDPIGLVGNLPAALAGRVAYCLDLRGPCFVVDTACSSSLLAVHEAASRLWLDDADYALAGGVSLFFLEDPVAEAAGIVAADGRSKAFDAAADGAGWGEGGGIVLLTTLERALRERAPIRAVLKGGAVNQDGGQSTGVTAPSPDAQAEVIRRAWASAAVPMETAGYIEAHGTGTELGDPIEIHGLTLAFGQDAPRRQFCALGSIKTNIGHLMGAAGIAGLTRAVLSLERRELYPSLHFRAPNPHIDFAASPVRVNTELRPWQTDGPRRAGVSSFGLSGTNVHVVLEEAPEPRAEAYAMGPAEEDVLVTLSARTPAALARAGERLARHLESATAPLADIAYTLNAGRDDHRVRWACAVRSVPELARALAAAGLTAARPAARRQVVLLFSEDGVVADEAFAWLAARFEVLAAARAACLAAAPERLGAALGEQLARQHALCELWRWLGLPIAAVLGHGAGIGAMEIARGAALPAGMLRAAECAGRAPDQARLERVVGELSAQEPAPVFLEAAASGELGRRIGAVATRRDAPVLSSLVDGSLSAALARLYAAGVDIDWRRYYHGCANRRVVLPTYPFERTVCWSDALRSPRPELAAPQPEPSLPAAEVVLTGDASETERALAALWSEVLKVTELSADADWFDLGGNSLNGTQLIARIQTAFGVELDFLDLYDVPTLGQLAARIDEAAPAAAPTARAPAPAAAPECAPAPEAAAGSGPATEAAAGSGPATAAAAASAPAPAAAAASSAALAAAAAPSAATQAAAASSAATGAAAASPTAPQAAPSEAEQPAPLLAAEQRLWFLHQLDPDSAAYHLPLGVHLRGDLSLVAVRHALAEVVRRHQILRTRFPATDGVPVRVVDAAPADFPLSIIDLSGLPPAARQACAREVAVRHARRRFDLATEAPIRAAIARSQERAATLLVTQHHIASDAWSLGVLLREVGAFHDAYAHGAPGPLPELACQVADLARQQARTLAGGGLEQGLAHFRAQLAGAPALVTLPPDRPRPAVQRYRGQELDVALPRALVDALRARAREENATLFMVLMAALQALLARHSGETRIPIGTPIAGRRDVNVEPLIGLLMNTLVFCADLSDRPTFRALLRRVRQEAARAYAHQDVPFEKLVEALRPQRSLGHSPLFQVMLVMQNVPMDVPPLAGVTAEVIEPDTGAAQFDLLLSLLESDGGLVGRVQYDVDLYDAETVGRMLDQLTALLERIAADPDCRVTEVPLWRDGERARALRAGAGARRDYADAALPLHALVERQVAHTPHAIAVVDDRRAVTYAELDRRANQLAHHLIALGVRPDARVAVDLPRSVDFSVALLGVLKAGAAYVPIDPDYPDERRRFVLEDAGADLVLTADQLDRAARCDGDAPPWIAVGPDHAAYVIYTSGSTGRPKGVVVPHRGIVNRLLWMQETYQLGADDRVLHKTPCGFDVSVWELFWPLLVGARLVAARPDGHRDPGYLSAAIAEHGITVVHFVPSMLDAFLWRARPAELTSLRMVFASGEALHPRHRDGLHALAPVPLHNLYGPTEASVDVSSFACQPGSSDDPIPIGIPIANIELHVLDAELEPLPPGAVGHLHIGGVGLARGYLGRAALTGERFVPDPFGAAGGRLYRTGDLARRRGDGCIEFVGRADQQVKIHGNRIELGEIEAALRRHPHVHEAVVTARDDGPAGQRLCAYVVVGDRQVSNADLRAFLSASLPRVMVPARFCRLESLPLGPSGKVDRRALPAPTADSAGHEREIAPPTTRTEEELVAIWRDVLGIGRVGIHENFFELGGDSILSIQVIARAAERGIALAPRQMFQHQTIAELARAAGCTRRIEAEQGLVAGESPLTPIQRWFFAQQHGCPDHWNQAVLVATPEPVDTARLAAAVREVVRQHDALRSRFVDGLQRLGPLDGACAVSQADLSQVGDHELAAAIADAAGRDQRRMSLAHGPLVIAAAYQLGAARGSRILLAIHHLVVDAVSWRILLEDLARAYHGAALGPKTSSARLWAERLAAAEVEQAELAYWIEQARAPVPLLPRDRDGQDLEADARTVEIHLDAEQTSALVSALPRTARASIEEALVAALAGAAAGWTGGGRVRLALEAHGREDLFDDVDVSRTVGWFTSLYPVVIECDPRASVEEALRRTAAQLRQVPRRGIGHGIARWLQGRTELERMGAEICFNYLGPIDHALGAGSFFSRADEPIGALRSPDSRRPHAIEVIAHIAGEELRVSFAYGAQVYDESTIARLADSTAVRLRAMAGWATAAGDRAPRPAMVTAVSDRELGRILEQIR